MLNIKIDNYLITNDKFNFILIKKGISKKGKETKKIIGYWGKLEPLLNYILTHKLLESDCVNVEELIQVIIKIREDIGKVLQIKEVKYE